MSIITEIGSINDPMLTTSVSVILSQVLLYAMICWYAPSFSPSTKKYWYPTNKERMKEMKSPVVPIIQAKAGLNLCPANPKNRKTNRGMSGIQMLMLKFILCMVSV